MRYRIVSLAVGALLAVGAAAQPATVAQAAPHVAQAAVAAQGSTTGQAPHAAGRRVVLGPVHQAAGCSSDRAAHIRRVFAYVGASAATQRWAVGVAWRESGCGRVLHAYRASTKDNSFGPFMLNRWGNLGAWYESHGWSAAEMRTFHGGTAAAAWLWARCGRGPWIKPYSCNPRLR